MEIYEGQAVFGGIAIGKIRYRYNPDLLGYPYSVSDVKQELVRYENAKELAIQQLTEQYQNALSEGDAEAAAFQRQIRLLEEPGFSQAIESMVSTEKVTVSYAVTTTRDEMTSTFAALEDEVVVNRIQDIREIAGRLTYILNGLSREKDTLEEPVIVAAEKLSPSEVMELDKSKVLGFVTQGGSPLSHTAIHVRAMEVPVLIHIPVHAKWEGRICVIDGSAGKIYLDADADVLDEYRRRQEREQKEREYLQSLKDEEDITADGHRVHLYANIGELEDLDNALENGARGIGLLRSEFQYLGRETYPREKELFLAYQQVAQTMGEELAVIRTLDIGTDKKADYMGLSLELNPAMGNRGVRFCLQRKKMFKEQLRAIYRASVYGNLAVMYPMVTSVEEIHEIQEVVNEVKESLREREIPYREIQQGIVVETPAAVLMAREMARELDFLSIGTNDLTQYTLAMDRQNPQLKDRYKENHPAIMKMIRMVVREGHREGCWVGICGELAADTGLTAEFLRIGVDMLSVGPASILPIRKKIRELKLNLPAPEGQAFHHK